jgi:hypothetical protein
MSVTAAVETTNDHSEERVALRDLDATDDGEAVTGLWVDEVTLGDWRIIRLEIEGPFRKERYTADLHRETICVPRSRAPTLLTTR